MDLFDAIRTTRSMRRLDPARDVAEADLLAILDAATRAASGGNSQPVRWLVVRDPELKRGLGEIYRRGAEVVLRRYEEQAQSNPRAARMLSSSWHLADHMGEAPVLVLPTARGQRGRVESSVFPAVQNLMLAARGLGLGTTLTTIHLLHEDEVKQLLGIPEDVNTFAIIPVGYPLGRWSEAQRRPVAEVTYWDRWGEASAPPAS